MKQKTPEKRDREELGRATKVLQATAHNPFEWAPVIKFVAPIIARIAARYTISLIARRLDKRVSSKIKDETVLKVADYLAEIAIKRTAKKTGK